MSRPGAAPRRRSALRSGGTFCPLTNPQNIAYWDGDAAGALGAVGVTEPTAADYGLSLRSCSRQSPLVAFVCAAIVDRVFRKAGMHWARATYRLLAPSPFLVLGRWVRSGI